MGHKIIIIEDREKRPTLHLPESVLNDIYSLEGVTRSDSYPVQGIEEFDVIAIHRSYVISNNLSERINDLVRANKYVILFSGGISQITITNSGHLATIGSEVFYSEHLLPFCKDITSSDDDIWLYKLIYGSERWRLPLLMKLRQLIWLDPNGEDFDIVDEIEDIESALSISSNDEIDPAISKLL